MPPKLSSATTIKRIQREVAGLKKEDLGAIVLAPSDENIFLWRGSIPGPEGSVYEGGVFEFEVQLAPDYPFTAPKVVFKTRIYHMNISEQGNICIDILKHNWSPALSLFKVVLSLSSLLTDPNPKDPLVPSVANQYNRNRKLHDSTARQWTEKYACPKPPPEPALLLSAKAQGKKRALSISNVPSSAPSSRSRGQLNNRAEETITIIDSDDEGSRPAAAEKRKRVVVDIIDEPGQSSTKKRAANRQGDNTPTQACLPLRQLGEVIIIEDD